MVTSADAESFFDGLQRVIFDELHAMTPTKRGDLLALGFRAPAVALSGPCGDRAVGDGEIAG